MKYFKKSIKISYKPILSLYLLLFVFASDSCIKEGLNHDQKLITDQQLEMDANEGGFMLPGMQLGIMSVLDWTGYQVQTNLNVDSYGGYLATPYPYLNQVNDGTYSMVDSWNNRIWTIPSTLVLDQWVGMEKKGFDVKYPDLYALGIIFKTFSGHRLVDVFGPIPYSLYGTASDVKFDSEDEAYNVFFTELTSAVIALRKANNDNPNAYKIRYAKFDKSRYGGNYATWIKVANTLRLRLAIRISKVNPAKAKLEAEAAVKDSGGVLTSNEGSFEMSTGTIHPLYFLSVLNSRSCLSADMESILGGYNDPRLAVYANPSTFNGGEIKGIRTGAILNVNHLNKFSSLNFINNPYMKLMDVAESYFLRAEGALRGWDMGGTAKDFYEEGIRVSFNANKVAGVDNYLNNTTATPKAYVDPVDPLNNALPLTSITIKWDENATFEQKLERIITQKWIAMWPEGYEAWAEFRRTGYPKLWPVAQNNSGGQIPAGKFIKRISYPSAITNTSQAAVTTAENSYLNGKNSTFEPIWWDTN